MPLTCVVCRKQFDSIGEVADHISNTSKQEEVEWTQEDMKQMTQNPAELENLSNITRGFAHVRYFDKHGQLLPEETVTELYATMIAGAKWCLECRENFPNNYRMYKHYVDTQHGQKWDRPSRAIEHLDEMKAFEAKWF